MPELPEIETIKRELASLVEGQKIMRAIVRQHKLRWPVPRKLSEILSNQIIQRLERRGKYLLFYCAHGCLLVHLGMSGVLTIVSQRTKLKKHDHVDICFNNGACLRLNDPRRFGCMLWVKGDPLQHELLVNLGVEPLSQKFNTKYLFAQARKRNVSVKQLLMNNKIVVGVGNIYAAEILFKARVHPKMCTNKLTLMQCSAIMRAAKTILKQAIKFGGTTFRDYRNSKGKPGYFQQKLFVYGRYNESCKVCGSKLQSIVLSQRSVVFCSKCQKM